MNYLILFVILIITEVYSNSLNTFGFIGVTSNQYKDKFSTNFSKTTEFIPDSDGIFFYSPSLSKEPVNLENDKTHYNLNLTIRKKTKADEQGKLFFGENLNFGITFSKFSIFIGRKQFSSQYLSDPNWKDGVEGITLETKFKNNSVLNLYLFDIYRGYPLFRNEFSLENINDPLTKGNRQRYSLEYSNFSNFISFNFHSQFLHFGNWGKYAEDDPNKANLGDGDFLYSNSFTFKIKKNILNSSISLLSSRGLDKTPFNKERASRNLPMTGEAINFGLEIDSQKWKIGGLIFLPDSNKRNEQGELLDYGYIGTGSFLPEGFLLSQGIKFIPSNWVTNNGLERNESFDTSRQNSFYGKGKLSLLFNEYKLHLLAEHIIPYKKNIPLNGQIYTDRKYFSKESLTELSLIFSIGEVRNQSTFLQFQISSLTSTEQIGLRGTSLFIIGGITL
jgi:hypothetical protein